ncbi:BnaC09g28640D [Brassica napus]|uniref:BnaC09g28640D protein n=1 Tax=Brassica napus TaxID=3708 RepID=A0A078GRN9_BRANA|nr:BnaC09g28640D [Brassica napus]
MIVHTPLEELQTSVSTSMITVQVRRIGRGGRVSKPDKRGILMNTLISVNIPPDLNYTVPIVYLVGVMVRNKHKYTI